MRERLLGVTMAWGPPVLVMGVILLQQLAWLNLHTAVDTWDDDAGLFKLALCYAGMDASGDIGCAAGAPYPPLVPWLAAQRFLSAGSASLHLALTSQWPFLLVLCGSLYMGMRRVASPMAGLAAMALGPVVVWSLHIRGKVYTEVPLAALVVAAVVALSLSEGFRRRVPSALLGLILGLGLLTKWSFAFFLGPPVLIAVVYAVYRSVEPRLMRLGAAGVAAAVPLLVVAGAASWVPYGLTMGFWSALGLVAGLAWCAWRRPALVSASTLGNVGLCTVLVVAVSGPWYWSHLASMQEFLAANVAQEYHGDPITGIAAWPFYPAVLTTRVMSTPLLGLALMGAALAVRPRAPALVRWSLCALLCGTSILGFLPYRSGRYVIAGVGLLAILALWPVVIRPHIARWAGPVALFVGLAHQLSWIPLAAGGGSLPHHWSLLTLPEPDLMGNTKHGVYTAYRDLLEPRWRFLPVASPPVNRQTEAAWVAKQVARLSREQPTLTVVTGGGGLNLNAASSHLAGLRPPATTKVMSGQGEVNGEALKAWRQRARRPRDQPATAHGRPAPRRLLIALARPFSQALDERQVATLRSAGLGPLAHTGRGEGFEPLAISIWGEGAP